VSWWRAEGNTIDATGKNPGTALGALTYVPGIVGQAFAFAGTVSVSAGTTGMPTGNADRTIELWGQVTSAGQNLQEHIFAQYGTTGNAGEVYSLFAWNMSSALTLFFSPWLDSVPGPTLTTGVWYHLAVTSVGNAVTLFVNGQQVGAGTNTISTPTGTTFTIGGPGTVLVGDLEQLIGYADEVSVYDRALSQSEIHGIYAAGSAGKCH
jgi:hypothetical protein